MDVEARLVPSVDQRLSVNRVSPFMLLHKPRSRSHVPGPTPRPQVYIPPSINMADIEKQPHDGKVYTNSDDSGEKRRPSTFAYDRDEQMRQGSVTDHHESFFSAFNPASFKRNPNARVVTEATDSEGRPLKDQPPAEPALAMKLKQRHLQMIAIGGSIGVFT